MKPNTPEMRLIGSMAETLIPTFLPFFIRIGKTVDMTINSFSSVTACQSALPGRSRWEAPNEKDE
jgi:hypothetical protein